MQKLLEINLNSMGEAYEEQRRQPQAQQLDFEERFAILVDRQWIWKEDRGLRRRMQYAKLKQTAYIEDIDYRQGSEATVITSQFPRSAWHEIIDDPTVADAILDRLVHHTQQIQLKGDSMRKTGIAGHFCQICTKFIETALSMLHGIFHSAPSLLIRASP